MVETKKIPFWLLISIILQSILMYYLFQKTQQLFIVLLSIIVYLIFALAYSYRWGDKIESLNFLKTDNMAEKLKKQKELRNFVLRILFYTFVADILISILFKMDLKLSSLIVDSGPLGILASHGLYDYKKQRALEKEERFEGDKRE